MSSLDPDREDIVMVRGGAGAGTPMSLDEVRQRLAAANEDPPPKFSLPGVTVDGLSAAGSVCALVVALVALFVLPR